MTLERQSEDASALELVEQRKSEYLAAGVAENTRRGYASDVRHMTSWLRECGETLVLPMSAAMVGAYLVSLADGGYAASTIQRRLAAISTLHQVAGLDSPTRTIELRTLWRGIRRRIGTAKTRPKPLRFAELVRVLEHLGHVAKRQTLRDRSIFLVGWSAALRRSELTSLTARDLEWTPEGVVLLLRRSKTDQDGEGRRVGIRRREHDLCPVVALETWIEARGDGEGPIWKLSDRGLAKMMGRRCAAAGLEGAYSPHSLRSGLVVSARSRGATEQAIMRITGHRSLSGLTHYLAVGGDFLEDPAGLAGLA